MGSLRLRIKAEKAPHVLTEVVTTVQPWDSLCVTPGSPEADSDTRI